MLIFFYGTFSGKISSAPCILGNVGEGQALATK